MSSLPIHNPDVAGSLDGSAVSENDIKNQKKLDLVRRIKNLISFVIIGLSVFAIVLELWSMYQQNENVIYVAGIIGCIVALSVISKQIILSMMESLRCAHNKIRMEINRFMEENNVSVLNQYILVIYLQSV